MIETRAQSFVGVFVVDHYIVGLSNSVVCYSRSILSGRCLLQKLHDLLLAMKWLRRLTMVLPFAIP